MKTTVVQFLLRVPALLLLLVVLNSAQNTETQTSAASAWQLFSNLSVAPDEDAGPTEDLDQDGLDEELAAAEVPSNLVDDDKTEKEIAPSFTREEAWKYFRPFWTSYGGLESEQLRYFSGGRDLRELVRDPQHRVDAFLVSKSPEVQGRVLFWMQVHTLYTTQMRVLHDRDNPALVYGYIDGTEVLAKIHSRHVAWTAMYRLEREVIRGLKDRIERSRQDPKLADLRAYLERGGAAGDLNRAVTRVRSQTGQRDEFLAALTRSKELLPYIQSYFKRQGIPAGLARIPFVESSFNPRAGSKVGAVGMFQFMPETAAQMIHPTNRALWMDPLRQTKAAAQVLKIFRSILPDWTTTATAYNSGVGRLKRLCEKYKTKEISGILAKAPDAELGFAGKNFFAQLASANLVEAYQDEIFAAKLGKPLATKPSFIQQLRDRGKTF